jgi:hypothetical protein
VGELYGWLARTRATGTLSLGRAMTVRRFHLRSGRIVLASSSDEELLLGHLLVQQGLVAPDQVDAALSRRGRSKARLGRLLARPGGVPAEALRRVLTEKARRLLREALDWSDGTFRFEPGEPPRARVGVAISVALEPVLAEAEALDVDDDDVLDARDLPEPDAVVSSAPE